MHKEKILTFSTLRCVESTGSCSQFSLSSNYAIESRFIAQYNPLKHIHKIKTVYL